MIINSKQTKFVMVLEFLFWILNQVHSFLSTVTADFDHIFVHQLSYRSSHRRSSVKKGILGNFAKFTGKRLCQIPFLTKFFKKETLTQVFSCESCEISQNTFFTEHLRTTVSVVSEIDSISLIPELEYVFIQSRFSMNCLILAWKNYSTKGLLFHHCTETSLYYSLRLLKITGYQECYLFFKLIKHVFLGSFMKSQTSGTSSENEWQRMTTSDNEWYNQWQRVTTMVTSYKEW